MAATEKKKTKLAPVRSLNQLYGLARTDDDYKKLLFCASQNLGGSGKQVEDIEAAYRWLGENALEGDEASIVDEINSCRNFI